MPTPRARKNIIENLLRFRAPCSVARDAISSIPTIGTSSLMFRRRIPSSAMPSTALQTKMRAVLVCDAGYRGPDAVYIKIGYHSSETSGKTLRSWSSEGGIIQHVFRREIDCLRSPPSWVELPCRDSLPPRAPACPFSFSLSNVAVWLPEPSATVAPPFGSLQGFMLGHFHESTQQRLFKAGTLVHLNAPRTDLLPRGESRGLRPQVRRAAEHLFPYQSLESRAGAKVFRSLV